MNAKNSLFSSCSLNWALDAAPRGWEGPAAGTAARTKFWAGLYQEAQPRVGWLKSALQRTGNAYKHRGQWVFQENFQAKFPPCLRPHTPFLFVLLFSGWLPAEWKSQLSLLKILTQLSVGSYLSFIFLVVSNFGRHRTTHPNEGSQFWNMVFSSLPAFSPKVPWEGSDLPFKRVSQSSLSECCEVSATKQSVHSIIILC